MNPAPPRTGKNAFTRFHTKLLIAMMLVVSLITALGVVFAERNAAATLEATLRQEFMSDLAALHHRREIRRAALVERCRSLVHYPRIHAALEDNALDLLYPTAHDELRDLTEPRPTDDPASSFLQARFYRFLDRTGAVIPPGDTAGVGELSADEESRLSLPAPPERPQSGYLAQQTAPGETRISEIIAMPIFSHENGELIAALVLGFEPYQSANTAGPHGLKNGLWLENRLHLAGLSETAKTHIAAEVSRAVAARPFADAETHLPISLEGVPHLLFYKTLNAASLFPRAYEISLYSLTALQEQQQLLRWQIVGTGVLLFTAAFVSSQYLSRRLSGPVQKLAIDSAENRIHLIRAEAALEHTSRELQRSARFSADASHQLKTPVTVLRAGLEELLSRRHLTPADCHEISALIHQTYRLASVIEDLLLLSRIDAGRLQIDQAPVDLTLLVEGWIDDLSALPNPLELKVDSQLQPAVSIKGEKRYLTLILQNLFENAQKYNRPQGRIHIALETTEDWAVLTVGNTGQPIPAHMHEHIFERFHRGAMGENIPGHGLGLNLARELARVHGGDLRLTRSSDDWTSFEARFHLA